LTQARLLLGGRAEDEYLADQFLRSQLAGAVALAGAPGLHHRVDRLAPADPAEELLVDGHCGIGGEHPARERHPLLRLLRDAEEATEDVRRSLGLARIALA